MCPSFSVSICTDIFEISIQKIKTIPPQDLSHSCFWKDANRPHNNHYDSPEIQHMRDSCFPSVSVPAHVILTGNGSTVVIML